MLLEQIEDYIPEFFQPIQQKNDKSTSYKTDNSWPVECPSSWRRSWRKVCLWTGGEAHSEIL